MRKERKGKPMKYIKKLWLPVLIGVIAGAVANLLAMLLLRNLGDIFLSLGGTLGEDLAAQIGEIFGQLKDQPMVLPWFRVIVAGCVSALLCYMILGEKKKAWRIALCVVAAILLFILLFLLALYYTEINTVMFGDAIGIVGMILGSGVL